MKFYNWNSFEWKCKFSFALFPFFEAFLYWRYGLLYFTAIFHLIAVKAPLQFSFVWKERDISKAWNIMISNTSSLVCYRVFIIECPKNKLLFLGLIRLWRPLVCNIFSLTFGHFRLFKLLSFLIKILKLWKKWKNEQKFEIFWKYIENKANWKVPWGMPLKISHNGSQKRCLKSYWYSFTLPVRYK